MAKIYTKTGDCGTTGMFGGRRMSKADKLAQVLGALDELNSLIGVCRSQIFNIQIANELIRIQNNLMIITTSLAGSKLEIKSGEVEHLERLIDKLTEELPPLNKFIYPVGYLQLARAVARRAEREVVALFTPSVSPPKLGGEQKGEYILKYLNRLSDALFTMGRWVNFKTGVKEEKWG